MIPARDPRQSFLKTNPKIHGREINDEESWKGSIRNGVREAIIEERSIWEASRRHLGSLWEASGKASGRHLGAILILEGPRESPWDHPGTPLEPDLKKILEIIKNIFF